MSITKETARRAAAKLKLKDKVEEIDLSRWENMDEVLDEQLLDISERVLLPIVMKMTTETLRIMFDVSDPDVCHMWADISMENSAGTVTVFMPLGEYDDLKMTFQLRELIESAVEMYQCNDGKYVFEPGDRWHLERWRAELQELAGLIDKALA